MNKEQSESENDRRLTPELGKIWIISDVFVKISFELQAYWLVIYKKERRVW